MNSYTVSEAKKEIREDIAIYLEKDEQGEYRMREVNRLPFFLQGPPGVGKTEMTRQIADELGIGFVSLSITHHTRNTVLGLPVIESLNAEDKYTVYTMSEIIAVVEREVEKGHREGILLIDEFACMAESLMAPMLAFLQTKNIGTHRLPEGWVLILCSNPVKYNKSARVFDMAIMDRVRVMDIVFDTGVFVEYGSRKGFHSTILEYLKLYPEDAHMCEVLEDGEKSIVTTRGWENLSWCLQGYERRGAQVTRSLIRQFIKNDDVADRFFRFYLSDKNQMDDHAISDILEGKNLSVWIDHLQQKSFRDKYPVVELLAGAITGECREYEEVTDLCRYLRKVKQMGLEDPRAMEDFFSGQKAEEALACGNMSGEFERREKKARHAIEELYAKLLAEKGERADAFSGSVEEYLAQLQSLYRPKMEASGQKIGNLCNFVSAIRGQSNLMDVLMSTLNKSMGVLDVMAVCKNPVYLKFSRENYAKEDLIREIENQLLLDGDDDTDPEDLAISF